MPHSAAALHVLRHLDGATGGEVLKLALKELVLRRVWRLEHRERAGVLGFRSELALARGVERAPALTPLMQLDAALGAAVGPETVPLRKAVKRVVRRRSSRGDALLEATRADLAAQGLLVVERGRTLGVIPRTRVRATLDGQRAASTSWAQEEALLEAIADPARARAARLAAGPLVLLVEPTALAEVDEELRESLAAQSAGAGTGGGGDGDLGDDDLAFLDAFDPGIDAAVDAGGGGGDGGGGDGGGGDGGGG